MTPKICLNMIVRNEAAIIERCLNSLKDHIDSFVILDTGSTDRTQEIITRVLWELPGQIYEGSFVDFSQARNEALKYARESRVRFKTDYILFCDADMELVVSDLNWKDKLIGYHAMMQRNTHITYRNARIIPAASSVQYVGATHEYLDCSPYPITLLGGAFFKDHQDGASRTVKFERDIELLHTEWDRNPNDHRTAFYLAQTYRDTDDWKSAEHWYNIRIRLGGWEEEVWCSKLQLGKLAEKRKLKTVPARYLDAYQYRPSRAEPLVALARWHRERKDHHLAFVYAQQAATISYPKEDRLFVDHHVYGWKAIDELAVAAFHVGRYELAVKMNMKLLRENKLPLDRRSRILTNLDQALRKLDA